MYSEDTPSLACSHFRIPPHPFLSEEYRGGSWPRDQTARQQASNGEELLRAVKSEPLGQSTPNFGSDLDNIRRTSTPKESARFGLVRPVDAHFRSALSGALAPNRCKPPRPIRVAGTQEPRLHRVSIPVRLTQPFARHAAPNFASSAPFVESAADRRQLPSASRKSGFRLNIEESKQQKNPEFCTPSQSSTPHPPTSAGGKGFHDQFRGEFYLPDRHQHHQNCTPD